MAKRDYYEVLKVAPNASEAEIKKAYRRLAMQYHPDRKPGDKQAEEQFKEAKEAYEILSDARKRAAYDQFGHAGVEGQAGPGGFGGGPSFSDIFGVVFGDIFSNLRGGFVFKPVHAGDFIPFSDAVLLDDALHDPASSQ